MEKSEKHRFSSKTKEIQTEKGKRHSKMLTKPKKVDYENPNPNSNIMMQQSVPVIQGQQFYGKQPGQMIMPYDQAAIMNGGLPPNQYIMITAVEFWLGNLYAHFVKQMPLLKSKKVLIVVHVLFTFLLYY